MKKTTVIIPCAGRSSRYPNLRPKFLLVNPSGNLMFIDSISNLNLKDCEVVVTVLKEHNEVYQISEMVKKFSGDYNIRLCVLDTPTKNQAETVYKTIKQEGIEGDILVKDCDNIFKLDEIFQNYSYVATLPLKEAGLINAANKSYVLLNKEGNIDKIREKEVISDVFCVGGYYFENSLDFLTAYESIIRENLQVELYVSMIIRFLIEKKEMKFRTRNVSAFLDLGTINEWLKYKQGIKTYIVDIDGVLVKNSGEYSKPFWGTTDGIMENLKVIQKLYDFGNQIILLTSRRESFRKITKDQLKKLNVNFHQLVMGVFHSQRVIINDFSNSNPYPSALAVNIPRDSNELIKYLNLEKEWQPNEGGGT